MAVNNPFLPLTKTGIHRAQVVPQREGLFLSFIENIFSDWAQQIQAVEEKAKTETADIGGDDLAVFEETYIKGRIAELSDREKRNLLDFFNVQSTQFLRMLHIIEILLSSFNRSNRNNHQYWGCSKQTFRKRLELEEFEFTLEERLQNKLSSMHRLTRILLNEIQAINPRFFSLDQEIDNPLDLKMQGPDVNILKSTSLLLATNEMQRIQGLVSEFKPTKVSAPAKPLWPKLDAKRIVIATVGAAILGCAIFVGINCIPAVGQAISLILAMSVVNSFLMTSFVGLGVGGLLSLAFSLTHIYLAAKKHYKPSVKIDEFTFNMYYAPGYEPHHSDESTHDHLHESSYASADETPHDSTEFDTSFTMTTPEMNITNVTDENDNTTNCTLR